MRKVKFRAWISPGKMQENVIPWQWDFCIDTMWLKCIESTGAGMLGSGGDTAKWEVGGFRYMGDVEKSLMLFAEIKDKNDKEIYEGDIVKYTHKWETYHPDSEDTTDNEVTNIHQVCYKNGAFRLTNCAVLLHGLDIKEIEVIGNIYENPNLLQDATL